MRIILVNPSQSESYGGFGAPVYLPLGLAYIGAVLERNGHKVQIINIDTDELNTEDLRKKFAIEKPELVGISVLTSSYKRAVRLAKLVKESSPSYIVLGGIHPTVLPQDSIGSSSIDFVVRGEGERTIIELIHCLENKGHLSKVDGLVFKNNNQIIINRPREPIEDLDSLPLPARHLFKHQRYSYPDTLTNFAFPIITSRGCPGNCTYCNTKSLFGRKIRFRSPKNIVDEIEYLIDNYGAREIHIWDDNFVTQKSRVFQIRDEIKKRNVRVKFSFPNGIRTDYINEDIIVALKDMGTYSVAFGVESGNQKILDRIKKGIRLEQIKKAFSLAKEAKFETWAFFILGLPGENKNTILETISFAKELNPDVVKFHLLQLYPGTEIFREFSNNGLISDYGYDNYGIHSSPAYILPGLNKEELIKWHKKAYYQFYLRPAKLINHLLRIKSWHRLKLNIKTAIWLFVKLFEFRKR